MQNGKNRNEKAHFMVLLVLFFFSPQRDQEFKITNEVIASTGEVCPSLEPTTLFSEKLSLTQEVI